MNVLVLAAHADDETIGCGGVIARHAQRGEHIDVLVLTSPFSARFEDAIDKQALAHVEKRYPSGRVIAAETRKAEACAAGKILGASYVFANFPEAQIEAYSLTALTAAIEEQIAQTQPDVVYTHIAADFNQDHRRVHEATMIALRPWVHRGVDAVYGYAVDAVSLTHERARVFVPLSKRSFDDKLDALRCYTSELREPPHPRSIHVVEASATLTGARCGAQYAEEFALLWQRLAL